MPDDDRHIRRSDRNIFIRELSALMGAPPGQVRRAIRQEQKRESRIIDEPRPISETNPAPKPLGPSSEVRGFAPRPFAPSAAEKKREDSSGPAKTVLVDIVILDFADDTFYYHDLYETGRKDAV